MTAAVAVMSASGTSIVPKRHGFSIESLIGTPESASSSPRPATPPRSFSIRHIPVKETFKEERHSERETDRQREREADRQRQREADKQREREVDRQREREADRQREREADRQMEQEREAVKARETCDLSDRQCRQTDREAGLFRERELVFDTLRLRDRELSKERDTRDFRDSRDTHHLRLSPRSASPPSPRTDKPLTPQSENRLGLWQGEDFKHILGSLNSGHFHSSSLYQPLRVCNRTLASMGGLSGVGAPPAALGMGIPSHFSHLQMNPLLYNLPRELTPQPHPLLAARYPGFLNTRYHMAPPPGLLFHPYRKPKRNRTAFSPAQLLHLEQAFEKNHYVVGQERKSLALKLQLTETQVKVWFQNRRTKHKRMKAEEDGGSSGSQVEGHDGCTDKLGDRNDLAEFVDPEDDDDDPCSDDEEEEEEEEELSVTEEC